MQGRTRWTLAGLGIGLAFLWLAIQEAQFAASWEVLKRADPVWALAAFIAGLGFMAQKTQRWALILRPMMEPRFGALHRAVYIGTAANLVVAHTGEVLRASLVARRNGVPASAVLATVAVERILDFAALLVFTGAALVWDPGMSPVLLTAGFLSLGFVLVGVFGVTAFLNPTPVTRRLGAAALRPLPSRLREWVIGQLQRGVAGLGALKKPGVILELLILSMLQWLWIVAAVWASAQAVGIPVAVSSAIAVFVLTVIGLTLPSSPAQLGTTQLAFVVGLELAGTSGAAAFAASLVYTACVVVAMMVLGALCWMTSDWKPALTRS